MGLQVNFNKVQRSGKGAVCIIKKQFSNCFMVSHIKHNRKWLHDVTEYKEAQKVLQHQAVANNPSFFTL